MTGHHAVRPFLDQIDTRERELAGQAEQVRARIEELTARLSELDTEIHELRITRKTLTAPADDLAPESAPDPQPPPPTVPDHPADQHTQP
ncbi:hypothetical protein J7I98_35825 [Streptomyces sp. ISL-98]|uniref:hypothetical protein n=1 Tax=Streptomyces sp. ISL-98 TaxID=2819192 RepID=UPI001BE60946|nr:hypothetical protein [Streptomyces sp. ISL-98]MBT2511099.1 hypothetical protein [Streptomyces sp. ISL-98]